MSGTGGVTVPVPVEFNSRPRAVAKASHAALPSVMNRSSLARTMSPFFSIRSCLRGARGRWRTCCRSALRRPTADALVFGNVDGSPISPRKLSRECLRTCEALGLPRVMSHALLHTHASALIAAGLDMVVISRRLGHANPTVALNIYGHLSIGPTRGRPPPSRSFSEREWNGDPWPPVPILGFRTHGDLLSA